MCGLYNGSLFAVIYRPQLADLTFYRVFHGQN